MNTQTNTLSLDLGDLHFDEVELLLQAGAKGMPEYAASCSPKKEVSEHLTDTPCCTSCGTCNSCSCSTPAPAPTTGG